VPPSADLPPTLCLVPTEVERRRLLDLGWSSAAECELRLCGFGPVAAAGRTSQLVAALRPARVLLIGIAGAYEVARNPVGSAVLPDSVALHGVGAGEGEAFVGPPALGFPQWPGATGTAAAESGSEESRDPGSACGSIADLLGLCVPAGEGDGLLLTTCAASASAAEAALRRERHPGAVAEDMEAFAVALSCALAGVPCRVVRGISNEVGDRDPAHWRVPAALAAALRLGQDVLRNPAWGVAP
jgi:futalosine hydrolase